MMVVKQWVKSQACTNEQVSGETSTQVKEASSSKGYKVKSNAF